MKIPRIRVALAMEEDRAAIYRARHDVYATELGQYEPQPDGMLRDTLGIDSIYIVATIDGTLVGFVGLTPPTSPRFSVDRYVQRSQFPFLLSDHVYEVRALTVLQGRRGSLIAGALLYATLRWVESHGGTRIVAMGRREVLSIYLRIGMRQVGLSFQAGAVTYELISATVEDLRKRLTEYGSLLRRLDSIAEWRLGVAFHRPADCYHGGAFFTGIGEQFDDLNRREHVISADVLDAWFAPAPVVQEVLQKHLEWIARTSPPTHAEGLTHTIARVRGVPPDCVLPGGGSSALIFLALRQWLDQSARVLLLAPTYGEYAHILERIIRCRVERFVLPRKDGYRLDPGRLMAKLGEGFDLFVWVNPNNPTGRHVPKCEVESVLRDTPAKTRVWIDETYVEYVGADQSLERFAANSENVVVCKSLSKVYALSGLRAGYLCSPPHLLEELRALSPPWAVSLAAQIAAVYALESPDYYAMRYQETHELRDHLIKELLSLGISEIIPGIANFVMFHLPTGCPNSSVVLESCRSHGVFLRDLSTVGVDAIRVAVKDATTNERVLRSLAHALQRVDAARRVG